MTNYILLYMTIYYYILLYYFEYCSNIWLCIYSAYVYIYMTINHTIYLFIILILCENQQVFSFAGRIIELYKLSGFLQFGCRIYIYTGWWCDTCFPHFCWE